MNKNEADKTATQTNPRIDEEALKKAIGNKTLKKMDEIGLYEALKEGEMLHPDYIVRKIKHVFEELEATLLFMKSDDEPFHSDRLKEAQEHGRTLSAWGVYLNIYFETLRGTVEKRGFITGKDCK